MIFLYKLGNATQYTCIKLKYMRLQTYLRVFAVYQVNKDGTAVAESILFPVRIFLISKGWTDSCGICYLKYVYQNFKRSFQYQIGMNIKFKLLFLTFIQLKITKNQNILHSNIFVQQQSYLVPVSIHWQGLYCY